MKLSKFRSSKHQMTYFDLLPDINLVREIGLYLDLPSVSVLQTVHPNWITEKFWQSYWYAQFDPKRIVKSLPYRTMSIMSYFPTEDDDDSTLSTNIMLVYNDKMGNIKNQFQTYFKTWENLSLQGNAMRQILSDEESNPSMLWNALMFEVSRGYYSNYYDSIHSKWIDTDIIPELDGMTQDDEQCILEYVAATSQLGNIVQALAFFGSEENIEHIYDILDRYPDTPIFQEFALLGALRSRNLDLVRKFLELPDINVNTTHLLAVFPFFPNEPSDLNENLKLWEFLESKIVSSFAKIRSTSLLIQYAVKTERMDYIRHFVNNAKMENINPRHIDHIYEAAVRTQNFDIFDFIVSKIPQNGSNMAIATTLFCLFLSSENEKKRREVERIFFKILQEFAKDSPLIFDESWVSLKINGVSVHKLLTQAGVKMRFVEALIELSYTEELELFQQCLNYTRENPLEKEILKSICGCILVHLCSGPDHSMIESIFSRVPGYILPTDVEEEKPSIELVQILADEMDPNETGLETEFTLFTIALFASIPKMNFELFEELRKHTDLTYQQITQKLRESNLREILCAYVEFGETFKIDIGPLMVQS